MGHHVGHQGEDPDGGVFHHQVRHLQHYIGGFVHQVDQISTLVSQEQEDHTGEEGKDDDLEGIAGGQGIEDVVRDPLDHVADEVILDGFPALAGQQIGDTLPRLGEEGKHQAQGGGQGGSGQVKGHDADPHRVQMLDIPHFADAADQGEEHQRGNEHFQQAQEDISQELDAGDDSWCPDPHYGTQNDADQDLFP